MNNAPANTQSPAEPHRTLQVVGKLPSNEEVQTYASRSRQKTWLGVVVIALLGCCLIGLVVSSRQIIALSGLPRSKSTSQPLRSKSPHSLRQNSSCFPMAASGMCALCVENIWRLSAGSAAIPRLKAFILLSSERTMSRLFTTMTRHGRSNWIGS